MSNSSAQPIYSIGAVAAMLGVTESNLRAWETRYGIVAPSRSAGAQRLYSRDQVEQLRFVKEQMDSGLRPAEAHRMLALSMGVPAEAVGRPGGRRRLVILLAERDPYAAELSEYFLRTEGFDVHLALNLDDARHEFDSSSPDLVIVDLMISGGSGTLLCNELRERGATRILALTVITEQAAACGADAVLTKPLQPLQLVSAVRDLLGTSAMVRASLTTA